MPLCSGSKELWVFTLPFPPQRARCPALSFKVVAHLLIAISISLRYIALRWHNIGCSSHSIYHSCSVYWTVLSLPVNGRLPFSFVAPILNSDLSFTRGRVPAVYILVRPNTAEDLTTPTCRKRFSLFIGKFFRGYLAPSASSTTYQTLK